jgi:tetratricopeptide (TPR) repeat protein
VLERAAIVGREFSEEQAAALLPEEIHATLSRHLETLSKRRFIRPAPSAVGIEGTYRFRHGLIQEAAYRRLSKRLRADLHERLAEWLERGSRQRTDEAEEILGYHLEQASRYRRELGDVGRPDLEGAARRHLTAAEQRAMSRRDYSAALNLAERALALATPDELDTPLEIDRVDALVGLGRLETGLCVAHEAADRAAVFGGRVAELSLRVVEFMLGMFTDPEGWEERMETLLEQALPELEMAGDDLALYLAYSATGLVAINRGQADAQVKALERSLVHARRLGSPRYDAWVLLADGHFYGSTPVPAMLAWLDEHEISGSRHHQLRLCRASALAMLGSMDEARSLIADVRGELRECGNLMELAVGSHWPSYVELLASNPARAEQYLAEAFDFLQQHGERGIRSSVAAHRAIASYDLGKVEEARVWADRAAELAGVFDPFTHLAEMRVRAKVLARLGEDEIAEGLARECVALAQRTDFVNAQGDAHCDLAEVLTLVGKAEEGASALGQAQGCYERKGNLVMADRVRARLADLNSVGYSAT